MSISGRIIAINNTPIVILRFLLPVIPTLDPSLFVILTLNKVKGKNHIVLGAGSAKGKDTVMLGTVSRDSLSFEFN